MHPSFRPDVPTTLSAEQRLCLAVLERARADLTTHDSLARHDAESWFRRRDDYGVHSFVRICDVLNLEPGYVAREARAARPVAWRRRARHGHRTDEVLRLLRRAGPLSVAAIRRVLPELGVDTIRTILRNARLAGRVVRHATAPQTFTVAA